MLAAVKSGVARPSVETLAWAADQIGRSAHVVTCRQLSGGILSSVHHLRVVDGAGGTHELVLKRFPTAPQGDALVHLRREAAILGRVEQSALIAPRPLGLFAPGAREDQCPALLMTKLAGRMDLNPKDRRRWLKEIASTLARIHSLTIDLPESDTWQLQRDPWVPAWSRRPGLWKRAATVLEHPAPEGKSFIHGDYQHFNLLWQRGRLSGVIDWPDGGLGHPDRDVGHCLLNLAVLFSAEWAIEFIAAYHAEVGRDLDRWWVLHEICLYSDEWSRFIPIQVGGRIDVDIAGMNRRVEDLLAASLE